MVSNSLSFSSATGTVMNDQPLVSVIIPNYCHARYLDQRIRSVLDQTYPNFEVIILDDCSPDGGESRAVIEQFRADPHISHIVYNDENSGSTFAQWHKGIGLSRGEIIWIAESDDFCSPEFLSTLIPYYSQYPESSFVYSTSWKVNSEGEKVWRDGTDDGGVNHYAGRDFIARRMVCGGASVPNASAVTFRRDRAEIIERDYMSFKAAGDRMFWIRMAEVGDVVEVQRPLNCFRYHDNKVSPRKEREGVTLEEEHRINTYLHANGYMRGMQRIREFVYYEGLIRQTDFASPAIQDRLQRLWYPQQWAASNLVYGLASRGLRVWDRFFFEHTSLPADGQKHLLWLDALKGWGILLIMLSHIIYIPYWNIFVEATLAPLFFVASGFVSRRESFGSAMLRRSKRLLIPYLFYGLLLTSLSVLFFPQAGIDRWPELLQQWGGLLYSRYSLFRMGAADNIYFLSSKSDATFWFLTSLWTASVLYCWLNRIGSGRLRLLLILAGLIGTLMLQRLPILLPWSWDTAVVGACLMGIGYRLRAYDMVRMKPLAVGFCFVLFLGLSYYNGFSNYSMSVFGMRGGGGSLLLILLLNLFYFAFLAGLLRLLSNRISLNPLVWLGRNSLRLMCLQMFVFHVVQEELSFYGFRQSVAVIIQMIVCLIVVRLWECLLDACRPSWGKYL